MTPALRAVTSRVKAYLALLSLRASCGSLLRVLPYSTFISGYHSCLSPPQYLHSNLRRRSQFQAFLWALPLSLRGYSTIEEDSRGKTVSSGDGLTSLEDENVASDSDVSTQQSCLATLDAEESVDIEFSDVEDSASTKEIRDSMAENLTAREIGEDFAGSISGDDDTTKPSNNHSEVIETAVVHSILEDDDTDVPSSDDSEDEEGEDGGSISESNDVFSLPDGLEEVLEDDDYSDIESAEQELATEGNVQLLTPEEVKEVLENVRARDIQIFPVHDRCEWTDLMVLATGISDRHVRGIAEALVYKIKKKTHIDSTHYPTVEGQAGGKWLVVDCGDIVIHVLDEESRAYYKLEDLWSGDMRTGTADKDLERMLKNAGLKKANR